MLEDKRIEHSLIMQSRSKLTISGVSDVKNFDDETVTLITEMGILNIKGTELRINGFSTSSKDIDVEGKIYALIYSDEVSGGFFKRLMR